MSVGSGETFQHLVVSRVGLLFHPPIVTLPERGAPSISLSFVVRCTSKRERERAVIFSFILFPYLLVISLLAKDLYVGAKRTQLREESVSKPPPETRATIR